MILTSLQFQESSHAIDFAEEIEKSKLQRHTHTHDKDLAKVVRNYFVVH